MSQLQANLALASTIAGSASVFSTLANEGARLGLPRHFKPRVMLLVESYNGQRVGAAKPV